MFCPNCKKDYQQNDISHRKISITETVIFCPEMHPIGYLKECEICNKMTSLEDSKKHNDYNYICKKCFNIEKSKEIEFTEMDILIMTER